MGDKKIKLSDDFLSKSDKSVHGEHKLMKSAENLLDSGSSRIAQENVQGETAKEAVKNTYKAAKAVTKGAVLSGTVGTIAYARAATALGNKILYGNKGSVAEQVIERQLPENMKVKPNSKYFETTSKYKGSNLAKSTNATGIKGAYLKADDFINGRGTHEIYINRNKILKNRGTVILKEKGVGHFSKKTKIGTWKYSKTPLTNEQYAKMMSKFQPTHLSKATDKLKNHIGASSVGVVKAVTDSTENITLKALENGGTGSQAVVGTVSTVKTTSGAVKGVGTAAKMTSRVTVGTTRAAWNTSKTAVNATYKVSQGTVKATKEAAKLLDKNERAKIKPRLKKKKKQIGSTASNFIKKRIEDLKKAAVSHALPFIAGGFLLLLLIIVPTTIITSIAGIFGMGTYTVDRKAFVAINAFMTELDADLQVELDTRNIEKLRTRIQNGKNSTYEKGEINGRYIENIDSSKIYNDSYKWDGKTVDEYHQDYYSKIHSDQIAYYDYINAKFPFLNMNVPEKFEEVKTELEKIWGDLQDVSITVRNEDNKDKPIFEQIDTSTPRFKEVIENNAFTDAVTTSTVNKVNFQAETVTETIINVAGTKFNVDKKFTVYYNDGSYISISNDYKIPGNENGVGDDNGFDHYIHEVLKVNITTQIINTVYINGKQFYQNTTTKNEYKEYYKIVQLNKDGSEDRVGYILVSDFEDAIKNGKIGVYTFTCDENKKAYPEAKVSGSVYYELIMSNTLLPLQKAERSYISASDYEKYKKYFTSDELQYKYQTPEQPNTPITLYYDTGYYEQKYIATINNTSMPMRTYLNNNIKTLVENKDTFADKEYWDSVGYDATDALTRYELFQELNASETYAFAYSPLGTRKIMAVKSRNGYYSDGNQKDYQASTLYTEPGWYVYASITGTAAIHRQKDNYYFVIADEIGDNLTQKRAIYNTKDVKFAPYLETAISAANEKLQGAESGIGISILTDSYGNEITISKGSMIGSCIGETLMFGAAFSDMDAPIDGGKYLDYDIDVFIDSLARSIRCVGFDENIAREESQIAAYNFLAQAEKLSRYHYYSGYGDMNGNGNSNFSYNEVGFVVEALNQSGYIANSVNISSATELYNKCPSKFYDGVYAKMGDLVFLKDEDENIKGIGIVADAQYHTMLIQLKSKTGENSHNSYIHYVNWTNSEFSNYKIIFASLRE